MKASLLLPVAGLLLGACEPKQRDQPAPRPVAAFSAPAAIEMNTAFPIQNTSTNADTYAWEWGDGTTSTDIAPSHSYSTKGRFRVRLRATGPGGTDTISQLILVKPFRPNLTRIAGHYYGRWLSYRSFPNSNGPERTNGYAAEQVTVLNDSTLKFGTYLVRYKASPSSWRGHKPERAHFDFTNSCSPNCWPFMKYEELQVEQTGDSICFLATTESLASYSSYMYYGKKQP